MLVVSVCVYLRVIFVRAFFLCSPVLHLYGLKSSTGPATLSFNALGSGARGGRVDLVSFHSKALNQESLSTTTDQDAFSNVHPTVDRTRPLCTRLKSIMPQSCPPRHAAESRETPRGLCLSCHKLSPHRSLVLDVKTALLLACSRALASGGDRAAALQPRLPRGRHLGQAARRGGQVDQAA